MKAIFPILALLAAPVVMTQTCFAGNIGAMQGYLPTDGTMTAGYAVTPEFTQEFAQMQQSLVNRLQTLPADKQKAFMESYDPMILIPYSEDLWPARADYEAYKAEWKKARVKALREVGVGLRPGTNDTWTVLSVTTDPQTGRSAPLTISALRYDGGRNVWTSNNGELTAKDFQTTEDHVYGAQVGTEWSLTKSDSLSQMTETIRLTRSTDGKAVYLYYAFSEHSTISNSVIAQGGYVLMFPVRAAAVNAGTPGSR